MTVVALSSVDKRTGFHAKLSFFSHISAPRLLLRQSTAWCPKWLKTNFSIKSVGRKQHDGKIPNQWIWNLTRWLYKLFLCLSLTLGQTFACLRKQWALKNSRSCSLAQIFFQIEWTVVRTPGAFLELSVLRWWCWLVFGWLRSWNLERKGKLFSSYNRQTWLVIRGQEQVM